MRIDLDEPASEELVHHVVGELDMASVAALRAALRVTIASDSRPVVLDLAAMTFIDAAGLSGIVWFASEMRTRGRRASLRGTRPMAMRVLSETGVDKLFGAAVPAPLTVGAG